jgi:hypothetical protein
MFGKVKPARNRLVEVRMEFWMPLELPETIKKQSTTIDKP